MLPHLYCFHKRQKKLHSKKYHDNDDICKWPDGRPMRPDYVTNTFRTYLCA